MGAALLPNDSEPCYCLDLPVSKLRRDGETQPRSSLSVELIEQYRDLMLEGIAFPPVRACFDGSSYWLTDGFHRIAAAEQSRQETIAVEIFHGTLADARWESYRANAVHGLRRTPGDLKLVITRALAHERGTHLSNRELARHLHVSEKTIRRLREVSSAANAADERVAIRKGREYKIHTANIGKTPKQPPVTRRLRGKAHPKLERRLVDDLLIMDREASPDVRRILCIFRNWTQRAPAPLRVLAALETLIAELKPNRVALGPRHY